MSSTLGPCRGPVSPGQSDTFVQSSDSPANPYAVPAAGGQITDWSTNTTADTAGESLTFLVLRPQASGYVVVGADSETLPSPLPVGGVATFTLPTPIVVQGGDTLGLFSASSTAPECLIDGSGVSTSAKVSALGPSATPATGQTLTIDSGIGTSPAGYELNVSATLAPRVEDAAVSTAAGPSNATAGYLALLASTVTNNGPGAAPITFADSVPSGLTIVSASSGAGPCTAAGQAVTCTLNLASGQSGAVTIVVTPGAAGSYANTASVAVPTGVTDPTPANNSATAHLVVAAPTVATPPALRCVVPNLAGTPSSVAKTVLTLLDCKVTKVTKMHSRRPVGTVISTSLKAGTYAAGRTVSVTVSSGPAKHKKHKKKH